MILLVSRSQKDISTVSPDVLNLQRKFNSPALCVLSEVNSPAEFNVEKPPRQKLSYKRNMFLLSLVSPNAGASDAMYMTEKPWFGSRSW